MIERRLIVGMKYLETRKIMNAFGYEDILIDTKEDKFINLCINQNRDNQYFDKYGNLFTIDEVIK